jgi:hypothetical protein
VNYFSFEMRAGGAEKPIIDKNVAYLADCDRARWKIENERRNVLKNCGYNLEHNFGHGSSHAADIF